MKSVNESRERKHLELALDVVEFQKNGGKITILKAKTKKPNRKVSANVKSYFGYSAPSNHVSTMFDLFDK